jgi:hypothetical protein
MYYVRPRSRVREVAGLFLWAEVVREGRTRGSPKKRHLVRALIDLAAALLLVVLACGLCSRDAESPNPITVWSSGIGRFLLCCAVAALLIIAWRLGPNGAPE